MEIWEEFNILLSNRAIRVWGWFNVSVGGT